MILAKLGLFTRRTYPAWMRPPTRRIRIERTTVAHSLWHIRTPYPTAIQCRWCDRTLYRFGTELRHRDGTQCPAPDGERADKIAHPSGDDGGDGTAWLDLDGIIRAAVIQDAGNPCQHTEANDAGVCPCGVTITTILRPEVPGK